MHLICPNNFLNFSVMIHSCIIEIIGIYSHDKLWLFFRKWDFDFNMPPRIFCAIYDMAPCGRHTHICQYLKAFEVENKHKYSPADKQTCSTYTFVYYLPVALAMLMDWYRPDLCGCIQYRLDRDHTQLWHVLSMLLWPGVLFMPTFCWGVVSSLDPYWQRQKSNSSGHCTNYIQIQVNYFQYLNKDANLFSPLKVSFLNEERFAERELW